MRVLSDPAFITAEIESCPDPSIARLLTRHLEFMSEDEGEESLTVVEWRRAIVSMKSTARSTPS